MIVASAIYPAISVLMGQIIDSFNPQKLQDIKGFMQTILISCFIISGIAWISSYLYFAFFQHLAENISFDLRRRFLEKLLEQEIAYFEEQKIESLPSLIGEYFSTISGAIGEKFSNVLSTVFIFAFGLGVAIYLSVVYAFISLAFFPVILMTVAIFGKHLKKSGFDKVEQSRKMGGVVEEHLIAIKLISSFA